MTTGTFAFLASLVILAASSALILGCIVVWLDNRQFRQISRQMFTPEHYADIERRYGKVTVASAFTHMFESVRDGSDAA
jgi:hypothetical protein